MRSLIYFSFLLSVFLLNGCSQDGSLDTSFWNGDEDSQKAEARTTVEGQINGHTWKFKSGRAYFKKFQKNSLIVQLWNEDIQDPCKEKKGSDLQLRLTAPKEIGDWYIDPQDPFNPSLTIFFSDLNFKPQPRDNMRADQGQISFSRIDKYFVQGYVAGTFENSRVGLTSVAGEFEVPFCSY